MITLKALETLPDIRHGFFTREGGVSRGVYQGLNCGFGSGDDRASVQANRDLAVAQFGLAPDRLASVQQIHSDLVVEIGTDWPPAQPISADGMVTRRRGIALGVLGADCAPILLADERAGVIGAAHAGWRGALSGILDSVVMAMRNLGAEPEAMVAAIGPCIARESYEVGAEFPAPFLEEDPRSGKFFSPGTAPGHFQFDLPGYIAGRLARLSVGTIVSTGHDTCRDEDRFFSYRRSQRRGEPACGRQLSAIALAG